MIWIVIVFILIVIVIFLFKANKETLELSKVPFNEKYSVLLNDLNNSLFSGEGKYKNKDIREHYLIGNSYSKRAYIEIIYRKNSLYLTYHQIDIMGKEESFFYPYLGTKYISDEEQRHMAFDFYNKVTDNIADLAMRKARSEKPVRE